MNPASGSLAVLLQYPAAEAPDPVAHFVPKRKVEIAGAPALVKGVLNAAVVGAGNLAKWEHLPNLQKLPNVRLARRAFSQRRSRQELCKALRR